MPSVYRPYRSYQEQSRGPSFQSQLTAEEIEEYLVDYVRLRDINNLRKLPLYTTHVRYFIDSQGKSAFRTGGYLLDVKKMPTYFKLCQKINPSSGETMGSFWSVQGRTLLKAYVKREVAIQYLDEDAIDTSVGLILDNPEASSSMTPTEVSNNTMENDSSVDNSPASKESDTKQIQQDFDLLQERYANLQNKNQDLETQFADIQLQVQTLQHTIKQLKNDLHEKQGLLDEAEKRICSRSGPVTTSKN